MLESNFRESPGKEIGRGKRNHYGVMIFLFSFCQVPIYLSEMQFVLEVFRMCVTFILRHSLITFNVIIASSEYLVLHMLH